MAILKATKKTLQEMQKQAASQLADGTKNIENHTNEKENNMNDINNTSIIDKMTKALEINEASYINNEVLPTGEELSIIKKTYEFKSPMGTRTQVSIMDRETIESLEKINGALQIHKMTSFIICKEFARIADREAYKSNGFSTIGEMGKAIYGFEKSTVNAYAKIGRFFINDNYELHNALPDLNTSQLVELNSLVDENGSIATICELFQNGTLNAGMSTKVMRDALKKYRLSLEDKSATSETPEETEPTEEETSETTDANTIEEIEAQFSTQLVAGKLLNSISLIDELFSLLNRHGITVEGYKEHLKALQTISEQVITK